VDATQILNLLTGAPMTAIVLYLLIKEQAAHAETRRARDQDQRDFMLKYSELARQSLIAVEETGSALRDVRDVLKDIARSNPASKAA
jgi:hypothetical protein